MTDAHRDDARYNPDPQAHPGLGTIAVFEAAVPRSTCRSMSTRCSAPGLASVAGLVGIKPTVGVVSRSGAPVKTLAGLIECNKCNAAVEMPFFGQ
jgi:ammonia channel protein AmtB